MESVIQTLVVSKECANFAGETMIMKVCLHAMQTLKWWKVRVRLANVGMLRESVFMVVAEILFERG